MLATDSMSLLWLSYLALSLVVLVSGYLGLAFLPRLVRLPIAWLAAGILWMPTRFHLPLIEEGEFYTGLAPAIVVATVALLDGNGTVLMSSGLLVAAGALLGMALGVLQAWWLQKRSVAAQEVRKETDKRRQGRTQDNNERRRERGGKPSPAPRQRQEPKIG